MAKLKTGRHTSAIKTNRKSERSAAANAAVRKTIRRAAKELLQAVEKKDAAGAKGLLPKVSKLWDKAAKTGVIHRNAAARKKSRLALKVKALGA